MSAHITFTLPETTRELRYWLRAVPSEALVDLIVCWRRDDSIWFCRAVACARAIIAARERRYRR